MAKSKKQKQIEADERRNQYQELSTEQKIERAKASRGGAGRQLQKLRKQLKTENKGNK